MLKREQNSIGLDDEPFAVKRTKVSHDLEAQKDCAVDAQTCMRMKPQFSFEPSIKIHINTWASGEWVRMFSSEHTIRPRRVTVEERGTNVLVEKRIRTGQRNIRTRDWWGGWWGSRRKKGKSRRSKRRATSSALQPGCEQHCVQRERVIGLTNRYNVPLLETVKNTCAVTWQQYDLVLIGQAEQSNRKLGGTSNTADLITYRPQYECTVDNEKIIERTHNISAVLNVIIIACVCSNPTWNPQTKKSGVLSEKFENRFSKQ